MNPIKIILTLIPFVWTIGMIPFVNSVKPFVMGLPFLAFWLVAGVIVAFLCLKGIYAIDSRENKRTDI